jgi:hypothetical protein
MALKKCPAHLHQIGGIKPDKYGGSKPQLGERRKHARNRSTVVKQLAPRPADGAATSRQGGHGCRSLMRTAAHCPIAHKPEGKAAGCGEAIGGGTGARHRIDRRCCQRRRKLRAKRAGEALLHPAIGAEAQQGAAAVVVNQQQFIFSQPQRCQRHLGQSLAQQVS